MSRATWRRWPVLRSCCGSPVALCLRLVLAAAVLLFIVAGARLSELPGLLAWLSRSQPEAAGSQ